MNQLKIIEMNCEELIRKMSNKDNDMEIRNELIYENETSMVDVLDTVNAFCQSIDSGGTDTRTIESEMDALKKHYLKKPRSKNTSILDVSSRDHIEGPGDADLQARIKSLEKEID